MHDASVKLTKRQREVLAHFSNGKPIGPWLLEWGPYYMIRRLRIMGLLEEIQGPPSRFNGCRWMQDRITDAGRNALETTTHEG